MNKRSKVLLTAAVAIPMALGGVGTAYAAHYQDRALPGSTVAGQAVAGMTRDQVAASVRERAAALRLEVRAGGTTSSRSLAQLGYSVDVDATVDSVFAANRSWSSYATSLVTPRDVDAVVASDDSRVEAVATDLVAAAGKVGKDASVALAADKVSFAVTPAVAGATVDPASFQDVVERAATGLRPVTATLRFVTLDPAVTTAAAQKVADAANALVAHTVSVSDGEQPVVARPALKASWVTIPVTGGVPGAPTIDAAAVRSWVDSLAADAKSEPSDGLRNVSAAGDVLSIVDQKHDGRVVTNGAELAKAALAAMAGGKNYRGTFAYDIVAASWEDRTVAVGAEKLAYPAADGEKWIDVDLGAHTMTAYVGAKVVYGPVAMVNGAPKTPTRLGTFHVYYKNPLMTMRGSNADGSDYETPDVPWSTFFDGGIALHGAYWRSTFGYAASHGCVNLPVPVAKWVYDFAPIGTPVAVHS
ncbi:L,D-transpeptidase family protein [Phycicoccus duodecadis]|uniref:Peptidoglycan transpeptidase (ErfK-YbiS-YhnG family) n=1 Tax=Phycicoccus duodecadis TaxID=173053 RepID=A0A2N3YJA5_9MICO|nr:L,D-transpeptidase family protein [Phycicoccus duodecadis]PKW26935.1 peptidoglycan transpeptidase precursor (ErfK-YbiS-YhnG family) [Phycicoccus duodecadis]